MSLPMIFGDQIMHSGRGHSGDLEDTAYLRCTRKPSRQILRIAQSAICFAGPVNQEKSPVLLRYRAGFLIIQNEDYKGCPIIVNLFVT